ncbi:MAG: DUF554 domain-containing protein [Merismopedia sp. SIO2A8]|nr:DUF554 domain-containing protein [Symploca sp. SIO2B6]NET50144.1 DUF554 domain-containing protein [Merismopedia sp. SIO2A8]
MPIDFWTKTSGTWINVMTVLGGTSAGLLLQHRLPQSMQIVITQGVGLLTLFLGILMAEALTQVPAQGVDGVVLGLITLIIGGMLGEWWQLDAKLNSLGDWLKKHVQGQGRFTEGFVATSLLFCIGPMAILGSLNNGLTGNNTILVLKATMDGLVSIPLSSMYGIGVGFSIFPIIVYQGGLSLLSDLLRQVISEPNSDPHILMVTGIGGLMILGIGLGLLEIAKIRLASFLPAIALAPVLYWFVSVLAR